MKTLSTGELARQAGVGVETVRFYERQGLLAEPDRRASGYRQYDDEAVAVIRFIRRPCCTWVWMFTASSRWCAC